MPLSEYINGYVSRLGRQYRVPTPVNDSLAQLVRLRIDLAHAGAIGQGRTNFGLR